MSIRENARIARAHYELFSQRDLERSALIISTSVHWTLMPYNHCLNGRHAYQHSIRKITAAFPDAHLEITHLIATDNWVTTELSAQGTQTQSLKISNSFHPATNKPIWFSLCEVIQIESGQIINARLYFDSAVLTTPLG